MSQSSSNISITAQNEIALKRPTTKRPAASKIKTNNPQSKRQALSGSSSEFHVGQPIRVKTLFRSDGRQMKAT